MIDKQTLYKFYAAYRTYFICLFIALFCIMVRVPFFSWPMISDEGGYAYTAIKWFAGQKLYSPELWFDRPQGIFIIYKLGISLLGGSTAAIRLWAAIWAAITGIIVYFITKIYTDQNWALICATLYGILSSLPQIEGFTANAEIFATCFSTIAVYLLLKKKYALSGIITTLAFLAKPSGGTIVFFCIYFLVFSKSNIRSILIFCSWGVFTYIVSILDALFSVGFLAYFNAVFLFRLSTMSTNSTSLFINSLINTSIVWLPCLIIIIFYFYSLLPEQKWIMSGWILSAIIGMSLSSYWNVHYYIQIIPPLVVLSIMCISKSPNRIMHAALTIFAFCVLLVYSNFAIRDPQEGSWDIYHRVGYKYESQIVDLINYYSTPEEDIYISYTGTYLYYLSSRESVTSSIFRSFLLERVGEFDNLLSKIENKQIDLVVFLEKDLPEEDDEKRFENALFSNYQIVDQIDEILFLLPR
jgi:4-amino-4-deoxy-L-arabinose transferase-like glycosyltransferase